MTEDTKKILPTDVPAAPDTPPAQDAAAQPMAKAEAAADAAPDFGMVNGPVSFAGRAGTGAINTVKPPPSATDNPHEVAPEKADSATDMASIPVTLAPLEIPAPPQTAEVTAPAAPAAPVLPGPADHSFYILSLVALLSLAVLLVMQQAASVYLPSFFMPSEQAVASLYEKMLTTGQWLVPPHSDSLPAALPVYFWFVHLVNVIPYADANILYPLVSAASAFVALAGVYALGLATGLGNRVSFAAGLLLLSSTAFSTLAHFLSPHLLFAGLLALSMACLYRGWVNRLSFVWLALGFMLAGISTLTGGLLGLVIPLFSSLVFIIWRGAFRRAHQLDAVFGFALLLIVLLGWLGAIILLTGESDYLHTLTRQMFAPFLVPLWPPQDAWWLYAVRLPAALMPWMLVILFVPWGRVCATAWPRLKASRSLEADEVTGKTTGAAAGAAAGAAWLWIALGIGFLYLTATSSKPCLAFAPLLPLAALLLAKALLHLPQPNSRVFFLVLALLFALTALALAALGLPLSQSLLAPYAPEAALHHLQNIQGLPIMALVCAFAALVLWKFTRRARPAGALMVTVLLITMLIQPAVMLVSPSLQSSIASQQAEAVPTPASPATQPEISAQPETPTVPESQPTAPQSAPALSPVPETTPTENPPATMQPMQESLPAVSEIPPAQSQAEIPPLVPEAAPGANIEKPADGLRLSPPTPAEKL